MQGWTRPTADVLQRLALSDESHITVDALLEAAKDVPNPPPNMSIADDLVKMTNTYDIRGELRAGGFRWNNDDKVCGIQFIVTSGFVFGGWGLQLE